MFVEAAGVATGNPDCAAPPLRARPGLHALPARSIASSLVQRRQQQQQQQQWQQQQQQQGNSESRSVLWPLLRSQHTAACSAATWYALISSDALGYDLIGRICCGRNRRAGHPPAQRDHPLAYQVLCRGLLRRCRSHGAPLYARYLGTPSCLSYLSYLRRAYLCRSYFR